MHNYNVCKDKRVTHLFSYPIRNLQRAWYCARTGKCGRSADRQNWWPHWHMSGMITMFCTRGVQKDSIRFSIRYCASIQVCSHSIAVINLHNFYCKITTEIFISVLKRVWNLFISFGKDCLGKRFLNMIRCIVNCSCTSNHQ